MCQLQQLSLPLCFNPGKSFDDFWVHEKNAELIYHLKNSVAFHPLEVQEPETSLFFWGSSSSGKSHLLEALCKYASDYGLRAAYVDFADVAILSTGVLDGLEHLDLVCLDNIHMIDDDCYYDFQVAVFRLFNQIRDLDKRLVMTSNKPAHKFQFTIADLVSRFQWGLSYHLFAFDQLDSRAFLIWAARHKGMLLNEFCADYIMKHYTRTASALINLLDRLDKMSLVEQRKLTIPFIRRIMELPL